MNVIHAQHKFQEAHKAQAVAPGGKPNMCVTAEPATPPSASYTIERNTIKRNWLKFIWTWLGG